MDATPDAAARRFAPITGRDRWCVPAAIAALTGVSTDVIRVMVVALGWASRDPWTGVISEDTKIVLDTLGVTGTTRDYWSDSMGRPMSNPTLNQWAAGRRGTYLVSAGSHMILFRDGYIVDNGAYSSLSGMPAEYIHTGKRARVHWTMEIDNQQAKVPTWAITAGAALREKRMIEGRDAKIEQSTIQRIRFDSLREEHLRKEETEKQQARKTTKTCSRCGCETNPLRTAKKLCTRCWHKARRAGEFGGKRCKVDGCDAIAEWKGCCRNHGRKHGND